MSIISIKARVVNSQVVHKLEQQGFSSLISRILAGRNIKDEKEINFNLDKLERPDSLLGIKSAVALIINAIEQKEKVLIVGDYDCDGATATALAVKVLRKLGLAVDFIVPNRETMGYGLSVEIVKHILPIKPNLVITVDNGIASHKGVSLLKENNIKVLITDHHLPAETLPNADAIVNPNQPNCPFPSKNLAGVGVMFYLLIALRQELEKNGSAKFSLGEYLDLVAIGTVADLVPLDFNNRILVAGGIKRIRENRSSEGIKALLDIAGVKAQKISTTAIAFFVAPRINAAGRLADMSIGISALLCDDAEQARDLAQILNNINDERKKIEGQIRDEAVAIIDNSKLTEETSENVYCLYDSDWHLGVVGIVASRVREYTGKPAFIFAKAQNTAQTATNKSRGLLRGSGRSVESLHLRDCLDLMAKKSPELFVTFGGHSMAAGATIYEEKFVEFKKLFNLCVGELCPQITEPEIITDGKIYPADFNLRNIQKIDEMVWGQGFPPPIFFDEFVVDKWEMIKGVHWKLLIHNENIRAKALYFNPPESFVPQTTTKKIALLFTFLTNEYQGAIEINLRVVKIFQE